VRKTLDEAAVKRMLDRAVQLDAERSGSLEPGEVHAIASELGISREAVDVALAEYEEALVPKSAPPRGLTRRRLFIVGIAAATIIGALGIMATLRVASVRVPVPAPAPAPELPPVALPVPPPPVTPEAVAPQPAPTMKAPRPG